MQFAPGLTETDLVTCITFLWLAVMRHVRLQAATDSRQDPLAPASRIEGNRRNFGTYDPWFQQNLPQAVARC